MGLIEIFYLSFWWPIGHDGGSNWKSRENPSKMKQVMLYWMGKMPSKYTLIDIDVPTCVCKKKKRQSNYGDVGVPELQEHEWIVQTD